MAVDRGGNTRCCLEISAHAKTTTKSVLAYTSNRVKLTMEKRVHDFGHNDESEMVELLNQNGFNSAKFTGVCKKEFHACPLCAVTGKPASMVKIYTAHVDEEFKEELQVNFIYLRMDEELFDVLSMIEKGTRCGERTLATSRSEKEIHKMSEINCFYKLGALEHFTADHEFCLPALTNFLYKYNIHVKPPSSCSSNKTERVERNNGVFKSGEDHLQRARKDASTSKIIT